MSASNWTTCPRCWEKAQTNAATEREAVMATYGTVPWVEFEAARAALEEPDRDTYTTFREDYGFYGAGDGEVHASYEGTCAACGLSVELRKSKRFWPKEER